MGAPSWDICPWVFREVNIINRKGARKMTKMAMVRPVTNEILMPFRNL
jgi:hypothetical protein